MSSKYDKNRNGFIPFNVELKQRNDRIYFDVPRQVNWSYFMYKRMPVHEASFLITMSSLMTLNPELSLGQALIPQLEFVQVEVYEHKVAFSTGKKDFTIWSSNEAGWLPNQEAEIRWVGRRYKLKDQTPRIMCDASVLYEQFRLISQTQRQFIELQESKSLISKDFWEGF